MAGGGSVWMGLGGFFCGWSGAVSIRIQAALRAYRRTVKPCARERSVLVVAGGRLPSGERRVSRSVRATQPQRVRDGPGRGCTEQGRCSVLTPLWLYASRA